MINQYNKKYNTSHAQLCNSKNSGQILKWSQPVKNIYTFNLMFVVIIIISSCMETSLNNNQKKNLVNSKPLVVKLDNKEKRISLDFNSLSIPENSSPYVIEQIVYQHMKIKSYEDVARTVISNAIMNDGMNINEKVKILMEAVPIIANKMKEDVYRLFQEAAQGIIIATISTVAQVGMDLKENTKISSKYIVKNALYASIKASIPVKKTLQAVYRGTANGVINVSSGSSDIGIIMDLTEATSEGINIGIAEVSKSINLSDAISEVFFIDNTNQISTQNKKDLIPPKIFIDRGIYFAKKARKLIRGNAIDESGIAFVDVNGKVAQLDEKGNFSTTILLKPGKNLIAITAIDIYENKATKNIVIERISEQIIKKQDAGMFDTGKYLALLIAVEKYQSSNVNDLNRPIKDSYQIKQVLQNFYSFEKKNITILENPSREKIIKAFDLLSQKIKNSDNLLIFFAGHGFWDKKLSQGYWLPSNASIHSRAKWLSNSTIRDYIRGIKTKHTLLVSDACFSGGIFKTRKTFGVATTATRELYKLPSRKAMTSGTLTEVPDKSVFIEFF